MKSLEPVLEASDKVFPSIPPALLAVEMSVHCNPHEVPLVVLSSSEVRDRGIEGRVDKQVQHRDELLVDNVFCGLRPVLVSLFAIKQSSN